MLIETEVAANHHLEICPTVSGNSLVANLKDVAFSPQKGLPASGAGFDTSFEETV